LADEIAEPDLPVVVDESGRAVRLRRSHRNLLRRALRHRQRRAHVLLGGGRAIQLDSQTGQPTLTTTVTNGAGQKHGRNESEPKLRPSGLKKPKCD
jgi:hypothetical protein